MSTLDMINEHAARLPEALRLELLHYLLFLEEKSGTFPKSPAPAEDQRREALAEAFSELERLGTFAEITDPAAWQREIRRDRPLPGREDAS
jgi:hypothetical protein